ncbi:MAG: hypothetical protein AAGA99_00515 [Actinomycetota bacterium]
MTFKIGDKVRVRTGHGDLRVDLANQPEDPATLPQYLPPGIGRITDDAGEGEPLRWGVEFIDGDPRGYGVDTDQIEHAHL